MPRNHEPAATAARAATAASADYRLALLAELEERLDAGVVRRLGADAPAPAELARRMVAVLPHAVEGNPMATQVGPQFHDTNGVAVVLAGPGHAPISKQAVEQRRKRGTVLAVKTSDGHWIYPTWQFDGAGVLPGLADVLAAFRGHPAWSVATWVTTPMPELDDRSGAEWLAAGRDPAAVLDLARRTARRWAA